MCHFSDEGPNFYNALAVGNPMNGENKGYCETDGKRFDGAKYCVARDSQGNSVLTGDNGKNDGWFTVVGLEVFLIE